MGPYIYFIMSNSNSKRSFFHVAMLLCNSSYVWCHMLGYTIAMQQTFSSIGTQLNDKCEEENWDRFN